MHYSNPPLAQCKGRSDSFTEISSDAPTTRRFGPPTPEEKARRLAVLRAVLADSAPEFQARIDAGERGSSRELPDNPVLHTGRDPADRTGIQCAPTPRPGSQDPVPPVRRPAARAAQGPPAQGEPDRDRARRSLTRIRPGQGLLLAVQPPTGRGPRLLPANRPQCPGSPPGGRLGPGRARGQQSDRPGYLADLASGAGNPPTPSNRLDLPLKTAGEPPLKPVGPESRIVVVEEREESPKFACERSRPETPPTLIPDPEYSAAPTLLRTHPVVLDCQPDSSRGAPPIPNLGLPSLWPPLPR